MSHKVLIVTYYWPPSGGPGVQRSLKFAKYLPGFGVEPVILTVENPTYPIRDESLIGEIPEDLKVYRSRTIEPFGLYAGLRGERAESVSPVVELEGDSAVSRIGSWIRANLFIPDARAGWLLTARRRAAAIAAEEGIRTIITTGPPHSVHFIGKYVQEHVKGVRWLADFRDPWSQVYYNQLLPRTEAAGHLDRKLEEAVLSRADEVIVVSRSQAEYFRTLFERGYRVITNGFDPEDFPPDCRPEEKEEGPLLIRHIGNIGEAAVPVAFLKALALLGDTLPVRAEFIGPVHKKLPRLAEEMNLGHIVRFGDYLPHRKAVKKMCEADLLLLSLPDVGQNTHHVPGKLFEYLGSGRPVLLMGPKDGDAAEIVREQRAGTAVPFGDEKAIAAAIQSTLREKTGSPVSGRADHPYSRITLAGVLADLIKAEPYI